MIRRCHDFQHFAQRPPAVNSHALTTGSPCLKSGQNIHTFTAQSHGRHAKPATNSAGSKRHAATHRRTTDRLSTAWHAICAERLAAACACLLSFLESVRALSLSRGSPSTVSTTRSMPHLVGSQHCCGLLLLLYSQEARGGSSNCCVDLLLDYVDDECQYACKARFGRKRTLDTLEIRLPRSKAQHARWMRRRPATLVGWPQ